MEQRRDSTDLNLTTGGITLLGVLLSVGTTVGFGLPGPWWLKLLAGLMTTVLLILLVKMGTKGGRGPVARLANWVITEQSHRR